MINKHNFVKFSSAFTLAEILITLSIIGVIAGMTIPSLVQDIQDAQYKTAYRKAFADASQGLLMARNNKELVANSDLITVVSNIRAFKKYFNVTKSCTNAVDQGCWTDNCNTGDQDCFYDQPNDIQGKGEGFIDNSGRSWMHYSPYSSGHFILIVDTNGAKKPNRLGRDRFPLRFSDTSGNVHGNAPVKVSPMQDATDKQNYYCTFGNCYYTSWLK